MIAATLVLYMSIIYEHYLHEIKASSKRIQGHKTDTRMSRKQKK
jgi:hypothetical protein